VDESLFVDVRAMTGESLVAGAEILQDTVSSPDSERFDRIHLLNTAYSFSLVGLTFLQQQRPANATTNNGNDDGRRQRESQPKRHFAQAAYLVLTRTLLFVMQRSDLSIVWPENLLYFVH
jgi:hypothetical protein